LGHSGPVREDTHENAERLNEAISPAQIHQALLGRLARGNVLWQEWGIHDTELYAQIPGVTAPWPATAVRMESAENRILVGLTYDPDANTPCPECGSAVKRHDGRPERDLMHMTMRSKTGLAAIAVAAICGGGWWASTVLASDHDESPAVKTDAAQDITDVYVFASGGDKTTIIVCWAGFNDSRTQPDDKPLFDANALYTIHVDNDGDNVADISIYWRYGVNPDDQVGIQWEGIPGADPKVSGHVETIFTAGDHARVWTGHADDPFFFDAAGYLMTLASGTPMFDYRRDFLAGFNVTAAAIEIDTEILTDGGTEIQVWATAARKD
jgi:hypothetical protein